MGCRRKEEKEYTGKVEEKPKKKKERRYEKKKVDNLRREESLWKTGKKRGIMLKLRIQVLLYKGK